MNKKYKLKITSDLVKKFNYKPSTKIETGINNFFNWYKDYYKINF